MEETPKTVRPHQHLSLKASAEGLRFTRKTTFTPFPNLNSTSGPSSCATTSISTASRSLRRARPLHQRPLPPCRGWSGYWGWVQARGSGPPGCRARLSRGDLLTGFCQRAQDNFMPWNLLTLASFRVWLTYLNWEGFTHVQYWLFAWTGECLSLRQIDCLPRFLDHKLAVPNCSSWCLGCSLAIAPLLLALGPKWLRS